MDIPTFDEVFEQFKINLWVAGIPLNRSGITIRYFIILVTLVLMVVAEASFFISKISSENFLILVDLAPCIVIGSNSVLKFVFISLKRRKINELATSLEQLYNGILQDEKKILLVQRSNVILKKIVKYYFIINALLALFYSISALFLIVYHYVSTKEVILSLPFPILIPFSTNTFMPWFLVYIFSCTSCFISVLYFTTVDALYCVLTSHVCSNFSILSAELVALDKTNSHQLAHIVKRHQNLLKLADDLEDVFSKPNLFNVLVGSLNICVLGFDMIACDKSRLPGYVIFLMSVLLQILMMSVFGENLITESVKVGDSAFLCKWLEMDTKSKKLILVIIMRSSKPQTLTAYNFSTIGYENFTKIISRSWSYFTILKTVYKPAEE